MENNETLNRFFLELFGKIGEMADRLDNLKKEIDAFKRYTEDVEHSGMLTIDAQQKEAHKHSDLSF